MSLPIAKILKEKGLLANLKYPSAEIQKSKAAAYDLTNVPGMLYIFGGAVPTLYVFLGAGRSVSKLHSKKKRRRRQKKVKTSAKRGRKPRKKGKKRGRKKISTKKRGRKRRTKRHKV